MIRLGPSDNDDDDDCDDDDGDGDDNADGDDLYIIGAVCLSVCHVFAYFPVCV